MVEGDDLLVKSVSYYCRRVPLSEIKQVEICRAWSVLISPSKWLRVKHRFDFFSLLLWRKGLLIELKDKGTYFFNVGSAGDVHRELNGFVA